MRTTKYIKFTVLLAFTLPVFAFAQAITKAEIDSSGRTMTITLNDCNQQGGQLEYDRSDRTAVGPHYYNLNLVSTKMGCPQGSSVTYSFKLPAKKKGNEIVIEVGDQTLKYKVGPPKPIVEISAQRESSSSDAQFMNDLHQDMYDSAGNVVGTGR